MGNNGLSENDVNVLLSGYRTRHLSKYVLELAEADLKSGLTKSQVDLYAVRKIEEANVKAMSEALHMGASTKLVRKLANMDEYSLKIVMDEIRGGMFEEKILNVLSKNATPHGMQQLFSQIKMDMANTKKEPDKPKDAENKEEAEIKPQGESESGSYKPEDIAKVMEPMFIKFTEGLTEALKPNLEYMNRMADSVNEMQSRIAGDREQENRLNEELDRLERQVRELQNDLASSAGVIQSKETEIGRLREEMAKMKDGLMDNEAVKTVRAQKPVYDNRDHAGNGNTGIQYSGSDKNYSEHQTVTDRKKTDGVPDKKPVIMGNCQTVLRAPGGNEIPVQIERTEARRPKGVMAMAAKLFNGTESQKALLKMLIEKRLTPEQLKEIKRAKDNHFEDDELTDLIESDLPAEEMAGIIDVIISDRK